MRDSYVAIGRIIKPRGFRGEVRIFPLTDYPERFTDLRSVYVENQEGDLRLLTIVCVHQRPGCLVLQFAEVTTEEEAEGLRGCFLVVPREEVVSLPVGSFYVFDLIGMQVETERGEIVGLLIDVEHYPASDVYVIDRGGKTVLIPAVKEIVKQIDLRERRICIVDRPGLLE